MPVFAINSQSVDSKAKTFSTGSIGYSVFGKVEISGDVKVTLNGAPLALSVKAKTFSTGSIGYNLNGKVEIDGSRYQFCGNAVLIGSKNGKTDGSRYQFSGNAVKIGSKTAK